MGYGGNALQHKSRDPDSELQAFLFTVGVSFVGVCIPPQANMNEPVLQWADQITHLEQEYTDSPLITLGDFNRAKLNLELLKYRQYVNCPTSNNNILDHCYTTLKHNPVQNAVQKSQEPTDEGDQGGQESEKL